MSKKSNHGKSQNGKSQNIADTLKKMPECSRFFECAKKTGVLKKLEGKGPVTLLVPTNKAFESLPKEVCDTVKKDAKREKELCSYHILKGDVDVTELETVDVIETYCEDDECIEIDITEIIGESHDLIQKEIRCSNGRIYVVNEVLCPCCCKAKA